MKGKNKRKLLEVGRKVANRCHRSDPLEEYLLQLAHTYDLPIRFSQSQPLRRWHRALNREILRATGLEEKQRSIPSKALIAEDNRVGVQQYLQTRRDVVDRIN